MHMSDTSRCALRGKGGGWQHCCCCFGLFPAWEQVEWVTVCYWIQGKWKWPEEQRVTTLAIVLRSWDSRAAVWPTSTLTRAILCNNTWTGPDVDSDSIQIQSDVYICYYQPKTQITLQNLLHTKPLSFKSTFCRHIKTSRDKQNC